MMGEHASETRGSHPAKPLPTLLVKRLALFFLVACLSSLFYWIVGSFAFFLDETQILLLRTLRYSGLALSALSAVGAALSLALAPDLRARSSLLAVLGYLLLLSIGGACLALSEALLILLRGLS